MKTLLIIPAYNEASNIVRVVCDVQSARADVDYIVINDGSTDDTARICAENNINCIDLVRNLGIGGAVQTGYIYARENDYDIAVQFDGDGQHDIKHLDNITKPVENNECDFCIGSRFIENTSGFKSTFMRRIGIRYISFLINLLGNMRIYDPTSGYRAANRKAIEFFSNRYPIDYPEPESIMLLAKNNLRIKEKQVNMLERQGGSSSIHSWKSILYMATITIAIICVSMTATKGE